MSSSRSNTITAQLLQAVSYYYGKGSAGSPADPFVHETAQGSAPSLGKESEKEAAKEAGKASGQPSDAPLMFAEGSKGSVRVWRDGESAPNERSNAELAAAFLCWLVDAYPRLAGRWVAAMPDIEKSLLPAFNASHGSECAYGSLARGLREIGAAKRVRCYADTAGRRRTATEYLLLLPTVQTLRT
jgi:hypothetical protein